MDEFFIATSNLRFYRQCLDEWPPESIDSNEQALGEWYYTLHIDEAIERQGIFYAADTDIPWKSYYPMKH